MIEHNIQANVQALKEPLDQVQPPHWPPLTTTTKVLEVFDTAARINFQHSKTITNLTPAFHRLSCYYRFTKSIMKCLICYKNNNKQHTSPGFLLPVFQIFVWLRSHREALSVSRSGSSLVVSLVASPWGDYAASSLGSSTETPLEQVWLQYFSLNKLTHPSDTLSPL